WCPGGRVPGRTPVPPPEWEVPGHDLPDHAHGPIAREFGLRELGPARMMIEVAGDERDVEIARLADRLAVVEALEHRQEPGVLLHRTGERVQVTRAGVARERGPGGQGLACG